LSDGNIRIDPPRLVMTAWTIASPIPVYTQRQAASELLPVLDCRKASRAV
jgi:hypothetical protein